LFCFVIELHLSAERVIGSAACDLVGGVLDAAVAEGGVLVLLDGLEDGLEDGDLAGDAEHALLLEPELLLGLPQQRREGAVLEVLHRDDEPLHRGAHAHSQVALGRRRRGARGRAFREGQRPLEELLGLALAGIAAAAAVAIGAGAGGGRAGMLRGDRELAPLLEHLLHAHDLGDLVRLLGAGLLHFRFFSWLRTWGDGNYGGLGAFSTGSVGMLWWTGGMGALRRRWRGGFKGRSGVWVPASPVGPTLYFSLWFSLSLYLSIPINYLV
jgi:hypothetical protein